MWSWLFLVWTGAPAGAALCPGVGRGAVVELVVTAPYRDPTGPPWRLEVDDCVVENLQWQKLPDDPATHSTGRTLRLRPGAHEIEVELPEGGRYIRRLTVEATHLTVPLHRDEPHTSHRTPDGHLYVAASEVEAVQARRARVVAALDDPEALRVEVAALFDALPDTEHAGRQSLPSPIQSAVRDTLSDLRARAPQDDRYGALYDDALERTWRLAEVWYLGEDIAEDIAPEHVGRALARDDVDEAVTRTIGWATLYRYSPWAERLTIGTLDALDGPEAPKRARTVCRALVQANSTLLGTPALLGALRGLAARRSRQLFDSVGVGSPLTRLSAPWTSLQQLRSAEVDARRWWADLGAWLPELEKGDWRAQLVEGYTRHYAGQSPSIEFLNLMYDLPDRLHHQRDAVLFLVAWRFLDSHAGETAWSQPGEAARLLVRSPLPQAPRARQDALQLTALAFARMSADPAQAEAAGRLIEDASAEHLQGLMPLVNAYGAHELAADMRARLEALEASGPSAP